MCLTEMKEKKTYHKSSQNLTVLFPLTAHVSFQFQIGFLEVCLIVVFLMYKVLQSESEQLFYMSAQ